MLPSSSFQVYVMLQIHESTELPSPFAEGVKVVGEFVIRAWHMPEDECEHYVKSYKHRL